MSDKLTAKEAIRNRLKNAAAPIPIHEFNIMGHSQNSIGSRLPEMCKAGEVKWIINKDEAFKRWYLADRDYCAQAATPPIQIRFEGRQGVFA